MTNFNNNTFNMLSDAFNAAANISSQEDLINGVTCNGDINYSSLGLKYKDWLLALDQRMVLSKKSQKALELSCDDKQILDEYFDLFISSTRSLDDVERAKAYNLMFRYLFYLRSVRVPGKKSRLLFYYLFNKLYKIFPKTCNGLLELVPDFGYFGDLDAIIKMMTMKDKHKLQLYTTYSLYPDVIDAAINVYIKHLNADCIQIFGKPIDKVTNDEAHKLNLELKPKKYNEVLDFVGSKRLSLASKWVDRERNSIYRLDMLIAIYDHKREIPEMLTTDLYRANRRINYYQMQFRNVISVLTQCLLVGEPMMCNESSTGEHEYRSYGDINIDRMPAKYITKYREALANQVKEPLLESEHYTGNRYPENKERVACRQNLLTTIANGKLKGAGQDLERISEIIYGYIIHNSDYDPYYNPEHETELQNRVYISPSLSEVTRKVISAQWEDIVNNLKKEINAIVETDKASAIESGEQFNDPRNVIPIIDTSGSMNLANVQDKAIALGILASKISNMPGIAMAFSENPSVYRFDMSPNSDVFDDFLKVMNGPTGYSTDIDKTYQCMLDLMKKSKMKSSDCNFAMLYLTDGQFNSAVVKSSSKLDQTALGRMENTFKNEGYDLPRVLFWNLYIQSRGFPASSDTPGLQLICGYSKDMLISAFTGNYKYVEQIDGSMKINVTPWISFEKAILHEGYDPVSRVIATIGEGCLSTLCNER